MLEEYNDPFFSLGTFTVLAVGFASILGGFYVALEILVAGKGDTEKLIYDANVLTSVSVRAVSKKINFVYKSSFQKAPCNSDNVSSIYNALKEARRLCLIECYSEYYKFIKNTYSINKNNTNRTFYLYPKSRISIVKTESIRNNGSVKKPVSKSTCPFIPQIISYDEIDKLPNGLFDYALNVKANWYEKQLYQLLYYLNKNNYRFASQTSLIEYKNNSQVFSCSSSANAAVGENDENNDYPYVTAMMKAITDTYKHNIQLSINR